MAGGILGDLEFLLGEVEKKRKCFVFIDPENIDGDAPEIHIFEAFCEEGAPVKIDRISIFKHVERKNSNIKQFTVNQRTTGCLDIHQARLTAARLANQGKSVCADCVRELYKS